MIYESRVYLTKVKIGSPPREFYVLIDTGSEVFWVSCSSCNVCPRFTGLGTPISLYDYDNSSTAGLLPCSDRRCKHCSDEATKTTGYFVSDEFSFDMIPPIVCLSQLSSRGITPMSSPLFKGRWNGGGNLLGRFWSRVLCILPLSPILYYFRKSYYAINLESIAVNGKSCPLIQQLSEHQMSVLLLSHGTTLAFFVEEAYEPLVMQYITSASNLCLPSFQESQQCYLTYTSLGKSFPSVTLNFAAAVGAAMWCLGFKKAHGASRGFTVLGDLVLRDKIVVYDLARQQLGWANYNCASPVNFSTAFHPAHRSGSSGSSGDTLIKLLKTGIVLLLMHLFNLYSRQWIYLKMTPGDASFTVPFKLVAERDDFIQALVAYFGLSFTSVNKLMASPQGQDHDVLTVCQGESIIGTMTVAQNKKNPRDIDIMLK
ncbi:aspartic proteinase-like protein 2 [Pyrus ussuriensis x Pyrus communis]|uniref:Aspartic proteinase-like protein 2 n=1 Tax=Pyrus ussuriensis x Pyrus communis TaxID=2448454 RepID=A0A5N5HD38_9ROSA|nr:aspartic proteinase-like protein 2 [Pyrus ussuriensis x Pyrus communis]